MSKPLNEQKVLKKLGIEDFRHLTKDKVIKMASMLDKMEPEVAKKAIEQFPNFSSTMKEIFTDFKNNLDKALRDNAESVTSFYETCTSIIETCKTELEKEDLSFEERTKIIEKMIEVANMQSEKDSENKKFLIALGVLGVAAITTLGALLLASLGGKTTKGISDDTDDTDNDRDIYIDDYDEIDPYDGWDDNDIPEGCRACGGNYPYCADSCPLFDD